MLRQRFVDELNLTKIALQKRMEALAKDSAVIDLCQQQSTISEYINSAIVNEQEIDIHGDPLLSGFVRQLKDIYYEIEAYYAGLRMNLICIELLDEGLSAQRKTMLNISPYGNQILAECLMREVGDSQLNVI